MNCAQVEDLLADALASELTERDQVALDAHLATCPRCRTEFDSLKETLRELDSLPAPAPIEIHRQGDCLVIGERPMPPAPSRRPRGLSLLRYAASVLIAFSAGFALHAVSGAGSRRLVTEGTVTHTATSPSEGAQASLRTTVARAQRRFPARSHLSNSLAVLFSGR